MEDVIVLSFVDSKRPVFEVGKTIQLFLVDEHGKPYKLAVEITRQEKFPNSAEYNGYTTLFGENHRVTVIINDDRPGWDGVKLTRETLVHINASGMN